MMNQQKSAKAGILKYSLIVPLALALVLSSNVQTLVASAKKALTSTKSTEVVVNSPKNNVALASTESQASKPALQKPVNKDIYEKVEKMPMYPGGVNELMIYLAKNIKYPADAQARGIQGRIIVRFVVTKEGKIEKTEILRSLDPSCDKEALRVVNAMPQWTPGEQKGKKVSVYYTLPIVFKLDDGSKPKSESVKSAVTVTAYKALDKPKTAIDPKNPPVYVIDGVKQPRGIVDIKPETIASTNILKPESEKRKAELIAQYGEDAANGVILITTKK
jgi:TonB family protein